MDITSAAIVVGTTALGGLVWLVRLEGRVNTHEAECVQRRKRDDERHAETTTKLTAMDAKLDRLVERA